MSTALEVVVYTKEEAAEVLKIGIRTLERIMASKRLAYSKVGGLIRITPESIDHYLESTRVKTDSELMAEVRSIGLLSKNGRRLG